MTSRQMAKFKHNIFYFSLSSFLSFVAAIIFYLNLLDQKIEREAFNKCNQRFNFLKNRIAGTWNNLPSKAVEAQSLNIFKSRIDNNFSNDYFKNQQY